MTRVQVQFTERQLAALKRRARETGKSVAAVVRDSVDSVLGPPKRDQASVRRLLSIAGKFHSDRSDVSVKHDEYLAEAIESRWRSS